MADRLAIGVDIGGTKIAAALVTSAGEVLAARQAPTGSAAGPQAVFDRIAGEINTLLAQAGGNVSGIGIGTPGQAIADRGIVRSAVNLGWEEVRLVDEVRSRLARDLPVWIQKDTNAGALGEYFFGAARGFDDFAYLSVGTGLGCGVVTHGRLVTGASWIPTELGHLSLDPGGRLCVCGLRGCAETIVSGPGLVNLAREALAQKRGLSSLVDHDALSSSEVIEAARSGDRLARDVFAKVGSRLGFIMAVCVAVLNPSRLVVGGGLGLAAFDLLLPAAQAELCQRVTPLSLQVLEIVPSRLVSSAVGASCLVWYAEKGNC